MKKILCVFFIGMMGWTNYSQELLSETDDVYDADVIQPKFKGGGLDQFYDFMNKNLIPKQSPSPGKLLFPLRLTLPAM